MNKEAIQAVLGWNLNSIIVNQLSVYQQEESYEYLAANPVLYFQSTTNPMETVCWVLSWDETDEGDDHLLMSETQDREALPCFERVEGFENPVIVGSSIHLKNSTIQSVTVHGYRDEQTEYMTSLSLKLEREYVTFYSGPVFTMNVTNRVPEDMDMALYTVGDYT